MRLEAERLCKTMPDANSRTIAKRLAGEYKCSIESARMVVLRIRGNAGAKSRKSAPFPKKPGKAGQKPQMPPSKAENWEPVDMGAGISIAVLSDIHIPFHDETALAAAVAYSVDRKPDVLLINGDYGDFYAQSRFLKNPKSRDFKGELTAMRDGLAWLRAELGSKTRIILKKGNHDERWDHWIWNHYAEIADEPLMQFETWLHCEQHGVEVIGDQRPIMAGELPIFHGHELPKGMTNPVNMARGAFLRTCHTVLVGHGHRSSSHTEPDLWHKEVSVWSTGCLCGMHPEYARINKWNHGFAFVEVAKDREFNVENLRVTKDGKVRAS